MIFAWLSCLFLSFGSLEAGFDKSEEFPVLYQGRFRSARAYSHSWLYDYYRSSTIKKEDLQPFGFPSSSLALLWTLEFSPSPHLKEAPLFFVDSPLLKDLLQLPLTQNRFSFAQLSSLRGYRPSEHPFLKERSIQKLLLQLKEFEALFMSPLEERFYARFLELKKQKASQEQIAQTLENEFPLSLRLKNIGSLFKVLPLKDEPHVWLPLKAVSLQVYDPARDDLVHISNFTAFSDEDFAEIQTQYQKLQIAYLSNNFEKSQNDLSLSLFSAYTPLAGTPLLLAAHKEIRAPLLSQLRAELLYFSYPWISVLLFLYILSAALFFLAIVWVPKDEKKETRAWQKSLLKTAWITFLAAFLLHTMLLLARSFILQRPPVANMLETLIYAPWAATCAVLLLPILRRQKLALLACAILCITLLACLQASNLNPHFEQVQAVLDSQFWLFVHVLLVVASYGFFLLASLLAFFDLSFFLFNRSSASSLAFVILKILYAGTLLLIAGTLLGGAWAAESWGRFWDWDPKEAWAFISISFYLAWIHAHRFGYIGNFGLSIAALAGLGAISFTWYGVNYILGTGLHSYGFGQGATWPYFLFLLLLAFFLITCFWTKYRRDRQSP